MSNSDDLSTGSGYIGLQICKYSFNKLNCYIKEKNIGDNYNRKIDSFRGLEPDFGGIPEKILFNKVLELYEDIHYNSCSLIPISLRSAKDFYTRKGNQFYFLVGDSSFTTHFFTGTGMNRGFASSKILLSLLAQPTFNRELLATLYNLSQKKIRDKLWSEIIPKYMFNACKLINDCMEDYNAECYYNKLQINGKQLKEYIERNLIKKNTNIYFDLFNIIQLDIEKQFINSQKKPDMFFDNSDTTASEVQTPQIVDAETPIEQIIDHLSCFQNAKINKDFSNPEDDNSPESLCHFPTKTP